LGGFFKLRVGDVRVVYSLDRKRSAGPSPPDRQPRRNLQAPGVKIPDGRRVLVPSLWCVLVTREGLYGQDGVNDAFVWPDDGKQGEVS
jgi:hypothetical protein